MNNNVNGRIYSDLIMDVKKKYIVRFKFNHPFYKMSYTDIGIGSFDITGKRYISAHRISNAKNDGIEESSSPFWLYGESWEHKDDLFEIEMRVCISDNILIFSDYPYYRISNFKKSRD